MLYHMGQREIQELSNPFELMLYSPLQLQIYSNFFIEHHLKASSTKHTLSPNDVTAAVVLKNYQSEALPSLAYLQISFAAEEGLATKHLSEDASNTPNIDGIPILGGEHDLWRSIPAGYDILRQLGCFLFF